MVAQIFVRLVCTRDDTNQLGMLYCCAVVQKVPGARSTPHHVKASSSVPLLVELSQVAADTSEKAGSDESKRKLMSCPVQTVGVVTHPSSPRVRQN